MKIFKVDEIDLKNSMTFLIISTYCIQFHILSDERITNAIITYRNIEIKIKGHSKYIRKFGRKSRIIIHKPSKSSFGDKRN